MSRSAKRNLVLVLVIALTGIPIGYGFGRYVVLSQGQEWGPTLKVLASLTGLLIAGATSALNIYVFQGFAERALKRLPLAVSFAVRTLAITVVIVAILMLNRLAVYLLTGVNLWQTTPMSTLPRSFGFALFITTVFIFVIDMRALVGPRAFSNFVRGRYHRPVHEQRVFAFVDLERSTAATRRLGDRQFHAYISDLFYELDKTIIDHGGEIEAYVGDAMILSCPMRLGAASAAPVACAFAIRARAGEIGEAFERRFGERPSLRVALHGGDVVTGETGRTKRQITFLGDTVNLTARLETVAKETGSAIVISGELLREIALPPSARAEPLGEFALRGIKEKVAVFALSPA